jgi:hypothetical protein
MEGPLLAYQSLAFQKSRRKIRKGMGLPTFFLQFKWGQSGSLKNDMRRIEKNMRRDKIIWIKILETPQSQK